MGSKERSFVKVINLNNGVTGSLNYVVARFPNRQTPEVKFIVDCGLFQEAEYDAYNEDFPFNPENLDFALITHNHVDHIGRIPLLVKKGFNKNIWTTEGTKLLLPLSLWDCHKIMKEKCKKKQTKHSYNGEDVYNALSYVRGCKYDEEIQVHPNVYVTFLTNGHLVGAAMIYVRIICPGCKDINLLFTGDYKNSNSFTVVNPIPRHILDNRISIIQESTYGTTETKEAVACFKNNILECIRKKWTVVILAYSLGRFQEILYNLKCLQNNRELDPNVKVYLDGNLALKYTNLFINDENNQLGIKESMRDFLPENVEFVNKASREDVLNSEDCKIIVTTSGMGSYGPAKSYISKYIGNPKALIQFTGYTAEGTVGAKLKECKDGEEINVPGIPRQIKRARVEYTTEFSAHAKADEIVDFLRQFKYINAVLLNHGEPEVKQKLAERIEAEIKPKYVGILSRSDSYRIGPYGVIKRLKNNF